MAKVNKVESQNLELAFRKHSLLHRGDTRSNLRKGLQNSAKPDFHLRDLMEEQGRRPRSCGWVGRYGLDWPRPPGGPGC